MYIELCLENNFESYRIGTKNISIQHIKTYVVTVNAFGESIIGT